MSRDINQIEQNAEKILSQLIYLMKHPEHTLLLQKMQKNNLRHCTVLRTLLLQILEEEEMIESNLCRMLHDIIRNTFQNTPQQINEAHLLSFNTDAMKEEIEWAQLLLAKIREKTITGEYIMIRQAALFLSRRMQQLRNDVVAAAAKTTTTTTSIPRLG